MPELDTLSPNTEPASAPSSPFVLDLVIQINKLALYWVVNERRFALISLDGKFEPVPFVDAEDAMQTFLVWAEMETPDQFDLMARGMSWRSLVRLRQEALQQSVLAAQQEFLETVPLTIVH